MIGVLLVDDEQFARQGLRNLIDWRACGYEVIGEADNGEEALRLIQELRPELVITDIRMPVLDGLELIRRVSSSGAAAPKFIIVSGYDDFKYAQQAMRYGVCDFLLKPVDQDELQEILLKLGPRIAKDRWIAGKQEELWTAAIVEALIKGEADERQIGEWERAFGIRREDSVYYVLIEINDRHSWKEKGENANGGNRTVLPDAPSEEPLRDRLARIAADVVGRKEPMFLYEHRNQYGMIATSAMLAGFAGNEARFAETLQARLTRGTGETVVVYVGAPVRGLARLREAYATAKQALQYKFVRQEGPILYREVCGLALQYLEPDSKIFQEWTESVESGDVERIRAAVDRLFAAFREQVLAVEAVKTSVNRCVLDVVRLIRELGGDERELASLEPMLGWHDLNVTPRELRRLLERFGAEAAEYVSSLRKEKAKGSIHKVKSYIDAHFHENISLKSLAAKFYMNPVYLGQLFRKTYGTYFNDYVLRLRVEEAKRLLRQTDLRIYEIAEKVGFNDPDYFVTQFEKVEGMTPSEYRAGFLKK